MLWPPVWPYNIYMRHSFIPLVEQKILKRGYRLHALVAALFIFSVVGLIGIGSLSPSYIAAYTSERTERGAVDSMKRDKAARGEATIEEELRADTARISALSGTLGAIRASALIERTIAARGTVRVTSISVAEIASTTATLVLQGVAPTRESLVSFKTRLEGLAAGTKADLPISELAKNKDISFSLKVTEPLP